MDLSKLAEPFPLEDIEWRVSRAGMGGKGIYCFVLAYITARAIQKRLDDVCGPENWRLEEPRMLDVNGKSAFACGLSILCDAPHGNPTVDYVRGWNTKWDVCEPTNIEPAKGGWSGALKRAGAMWSIGRYLYHLDETFAEVSESKPMNSSRQWKYAKLSKDHGGSVYYWKPPELPAWALPKEPEYEISLDQLNALKRAWQDKFAEGLSLEETRNGFSRFVEKHVGEFPIADYTCWTTDALAKCNTAIEADNGADGIDDDVPFGE